MLKKLLTACAGIVLVGQSAFAQYNQPMNNLPPSAPRQETPANNPPVIFVGEIEGMPVVIALTQENGNAVRGMLMIGNQKYPIVGQFENNVVKGVWQSENGQFPFVAQLGNGGMQFQTNGKTVSLTLNRPQNNNQPRQQEPAPQPRYQEPAPQPQYQPQNPPQYQPQQQPQNQPQQQNGPQAQMKSGRYYNVPVLQGWKTFEDKDSVLAVSPDGKSAYGSIYRTVDARMTPADVIKSTLDGFGVKDVQVVNSEDRRAESGIEMTTMIAHFVGGDGVRRTGLFRASVLRKNGQALSLLLHAATPAEEFQANGKTLVMLSTQITNVEETAQNPQPGYQQQQPGYQPQPQPGYQPNYQPRQVPVNTPSYSPSAPSMNQAPSYDRQY